MESVTYTYTDGELVPELDGIDPIDFIKPDPSFTRRETRSHILKELKNWLCGIRMTHAVEQLITEDVSIDSIKDDVEAGLFPAGRMFMILRRLDPTLAGIWGYKDAGYLCYSICAAHLTGQKFYMADDIQSLILGFITTDKLPSGKVIESFWDYSPFDPLREAEPLSEDSDEEEEEGEEGDEDEEGEDEEDEEPKSEDNCTISITIIAICLMVLIFNLSLFLLLKATDSLHVSRFPTPLRDL